jgi:hypothetical protein
MPRLNRKVILHNVADAREELQRIEAMLAADERLEPINLQVAMQHAFHHLCFAWNARHWPNKRYSNLSRADFESAGSFPTDLAFED